jgi:hypothetical protein
MSTALDDLLARVSAMPEDAQAKFKNDILNRTTALTWFPNDGPQTQAYFSLADITLYGGQAGGGKTDLLMGLGSQKHKRSIIFRRESSQTDGLEATGKRIIGDNASFNGVDKEWEWEDGRSLKLAGMKEPDDWMKHAGRERDLIGYDEAGEFLEVQVRSMVAWLRGPENQRARMVLASNPPRTSDGLWMLKWFAPWLDPSFGNPALPGELRYGIFVGDDLIWVDGPGVSEVKGETYIHQSFTFIPASLEDNPYRNTPEYRSKLQSLPEPLRSQLLYGDFTAGIKDGERQVIPTDWIIAAQNRWTPIPPEGMAMTAMAKDAKGGGEDQGELCYRYGGWYGPIVTSMVDDTKDGSKSAAEIVQYRRDNCPIIVDAGGGYGGAIMMRLKDNVDDETKIVGFNGANKTTAKTKDGQLAFANKRSEGYWKLREELDPTQEGGSHIALPPDPELRGDLAAPTWTLTSQGIQVEPKEVYKDGKLVGGIKKRLGRSPGKGDTVMMCLSEGNAAHKRAIANNGHRPQVIQAYADRKRIR